MKLKYQTKSNGKEYLMYSISLRCNEKEIEYAEPSMPLAPAPAPSSSMPAWCFE